MQNLGRYQIIEQLGAGAMGAVYKARDPMMGREVAIKTILTQAIEGAQSAEFRERFFREAQAAGRLTHAGIVTTYDVSEHEKTPFLVMEYVAGRTLQSILQSERLDTDRVYDLGVQLADALDYAHQHGVIHRDIKPANILITPDGRLKIADFGVAKLAESQVTSTGQLLGTPAFMAPEQFTGAKTDGRADLFAAGIVLYWMATGDKPFTGDSTLAVQYKIVHTDPIPPRRLNPALAEDFEAVILKCIAKNPAERYQHGAELAHDLSALREGRPITVHVPMRISSDDPTMLVTEIKVRPKTVINADRTTHLKPAMNGEPAKRRNIVPVVLLFAAGIALAAIGISRTSRQQAPAPAAQTLPAGDPPAPPTPDQPAAPPDSASPETVKPPAAVNKREPVVNKSASPVAAVPGETPPPAAPDSGAMDDSPAGRGNRNLVGSPARQKELAKLTDSVRLMIKSPALPEYLTLIVRLDNGFFYRREATAPVPAGLETPRGRVPAASIPTVPLAEERLMPPGAHKLQVSVLLGTTRIGQVQELDAQLDPGQRRTLNIQFVHDAQRAVGRGAGANRLSISLE